MQERGVGRSGSGVVVFHTFRIFVFLRQYMFHYRPEEPRLGGGVSLSVSSHCINRVLPGGQATRDF